MWVWSHFSQRATWPPSAAVRQRSIADMTFSWSRLAWPALACRHAGPWSRKISATSSAGRDMTPLRRRLVLPVLLGGQRRETIQRTHDRADHVGGDMRVERGRIKLGMSEQNLDQTHIGFLLDQVGGKAMPQGVRRHPLLDLGHGGGGVNGAIELSRRHRQHRITAGEQPDCGSGDAIPVAQQLQQPWGEHRKAILAPLTLLDPQ